MVVKFNFSEMHGDVERTLSMEYDGDPGPAFDAVVINFVGQWDKSGRFIMTSGGIPVFRHKILEIKRRENVG